jgi:hypothetical protein
MPTTPIDELSADLNNIKLNDDGTISPEPASAARRVYDITEIFRNILRYLNRDELAVMMRLEKGATHLVAEQLYNDMAVDVANTVDENGVSRSYQIQLRFANSSLEGRFI